MYIGSFVINYILIILTFSLSGLCRKVPNNRIDKNNNNKQVLVMFNS